MPTQMRMGFQSSQVPMFKMERTVAEVLPLSSLVKITCQRKGCGGWFIVDGKALLASRPDTITAPCPHCFKVSRIRKERK